MFEQDDCIIPIEKINTDLVLMNRKKLEQLDQYFALLKRCKPWLKDQRKIVAAIVKPSKGSDREGKLQKQLADLTALLSDIEKMEAEK